MTNLAIECSGTAGSVALFDGENPICYVDLDVGLRSVRTLASAIERIIRGRDKPNVISVTNGPGSFTGLRVGVTTAKMLAMAWSIPVVPVDTLQAIAFRAHSVAPQSHAAGPILGVIDAFRGQVFVTAVQFLEPAKLTVLVPSCVLDAQRWRENPLRALGNLEALGNLASPGNVVRALVSGPGLRNYPLLDESVNGFSFQTVSPDVWNPTAAEVARLGQLGLKAGLAKSAFTLEPNYIRASAAEEKTKSSQP